KVDNIEGGVTRIEKTLTAFMVKADESYAGKFIEKEVADLKENRAWIIKLVLAVVIIAVLGVVIVKNTSSPTTVQDINLDKKIEAAVEAKLK
ncbi:MAG TPA: hypothetical protein VIJ25_17795, partial [Methylococcales bacterium]